MYIIEDEKEFERNKAYLQKQLDVIIEGNT